MTEVNTPFDMLGAQIYVDAYVNMLSTEYRIDQLAFDCHMISVSRGWWTDIKTGEPTPRNFGEMIALMHSELSEALEGDRKNLQSDHIPGFTMVEEEFADALIRIFDCAAARKLRLGQAFKEKCRYNLTREDHSIAARLDGGKTY